MNFMCTMGAGSIFTFNAARVVASNSLAIHIFCHKVNIVLHKSQSQSPQPSQNARFSRLGLIEDFEHGQRCGEGELHAMRGNKRLFMMLWWIQGTNHGSNASLGYRIGRGLTSPLNRISVFCSRRSEFSSWALGQPALEQQLVSTNLGTPAGSWSTRQVVFFFFLLGRCCRCCRCPWHSNTSNMCTR